MHRYKVLTWYTTPPIGGITRWCRRQQISAWSAAAAALWVVVPGEITKMRISRVDGSEPTVEFRGRPKSV